MAYTIRNTDGSILLLLSDGRVDSNSTSITLVGKNYTSYGEIWNNNLVKLMGNFSNANSPNSPLKGQLWYDSLNKKLNVYDEGWEPLNGAQISNTQPSFLSNGDLWFDSANDQLYIRTAGTVKLIGPAFSKEVGSNGWVLPPVAIQDNSNGSSGAVKQVTLLRNYGQTLGYISTQTFAIASTSTYSYITNNTTSTINGLTVFGDVRATNRLIANTLTVTSSIIYPVSDRVSESEELDFYTEIGNIAIRVFNTGPVFEPQIRTVTGSATITLGGFCVTSGVMKSVSKGSTALTTTPIALLNVPADNFSLLGDMLQIILTDLTDPSEAGIKTYRITMQLATISPTVRATIVAEKIK